jgi:CRISPR-associated exonuclease Cas4
VSSVAFVTTICLLVAALALYVFARQLRRRSGLPDGKVIYSDTGAWQRNEQSFFSATYGITGKPDYLVRDHKMIVPVEVKSSSAPTTPREGHVMQLAMYCLLVEENMSQRPAYGMIQYSDRAFKVEFTDELRAHVLHTLSEMRLAAELSDGPHRSHQNPHRCSGCGLREACDERLM